MRKGFHCIRVPLILVLGLQLAAMASTPARPNFTPPPPPDHEPPPPPEGPPPSVPLSLRGYMDGSVDPLAEENLVLGRGAMDGTREVSLKFSREDILEVPANSPHSPELTYEYEVKEYKSGMDGSDLRFEVVKEIRQFSATLEPDIVEVVRMMIDEKCLPVLILNLFGDEIRIGVNHLKAERFNAVLIGSVNTKSPFGLKGYISANGSYRFEIQRAGEFPIIVSKKLDESFADISQTIGEKRFPMPNDANLGNPEDLEVDCRREFQELRGKKYIAEICSDEVGQVVRKEKYWASDLIVRTEGGKDDTIAELVNVNGVISVHDEFGDYLYVLVDPANLDEHDAIIREIESLPNVRFVFNNSPVNPVW